MNRRNLWAPWRMRYLETLVEEEAALREAGAAGKANDLPSGGCFLTDYWLHPENDESNFIVHRNEHGFILLNRYPYSNGHLLVALGDGRPRLLEYEPDQRAQLWLLIEHATDLMQRALNPQGMNIGINEGRAAGAGVPEHLHVHLVPRWSGDTNFITVVGDVRVVPDSLEKMYQRYRAVVDG